MVQINAHCFQRSLTGVWFDQWPEEWLNELPRSAYGTSSRLFLPMRVEGRTHRLGVVSVVPMNPMVGCDVSADETYITAITRGGNSTGKAGELLNSSLV